MIENIKSNKDSTQSDQPAFPQRSNNAAWIIGIYLPIQVLILSGYACLICITENGRSIIDYLFFLPISIHDEIFANFEPVRMYLLAICGAGIGGAVFMIREYYLMYCYGKYSSEKHKSPIESELPEKLDSTEKPEVPKKTKSSDKEYLQMYELPRYLLLPLSATVLGPVGIALIQAGGIVALGTTGSEIIPKYTVFLVSFLLGFTYHDSLGALRKLSGKIWPGSDNT